ncbi:hypothetical protein C8T65DRAFT_297514 [Cerioporus squamosus]|nr:hypothetical protein C8T65DRAFT_297514 [Cerioporus squamosus]
MQDWQPHRHPHNLTIAMHSSQQRTLHQRIFRAEPGFPVTFDQLRVCYNDHRDAEALDELVVRRIELRRRPGDTYYVLVHIAATTAASSQDQVVGYVAVTDVPSPHSSPPPDSHRFLPHTFSRKSAARTASAQVIDRDALVLPRDDVCLRRHVFPTPCPFACVIAAGFSVGPQIPSAGHRKPRSSWFAALMFWLLEGEERVDEAAVDQQRCELEHDFARRTGTAVWKAQVEKLEKEAASEGRRQV